MLAAHGRGGLDRPSAAKDREPGKAALQIRRQKIVAPLDGGSQGLVALRSVTAAAAQQLGENNLRSVICKDLADLHVKLTEGAAAAVVTEEAFLHHSTSELEDWVRERSS